MVVYTGIWCWVVDGGWCIQVFDYGRWMGDGVHRYLVMGGGTQVLGKTQPESESVCPPGKQSGNCG